jgi:hypothetical protein
MRVSPTNAREVAAVIADLGVSIDRRNARGGFIHDELMAAMRTGNYEIARFILDRWNFRSFSRGGGLEVAVVHYLFTDEYKFGNGFDLVEQLMRFMGAYNNFALEDSSFLCEHNVLNALLEPHYTRDAASIFSANANSVENRVIVHVAKYAASGEDESYEATSLLCKWFLTKLIEFGPSAPFDGGYAAMSVAMYDQLHDFLMLVYNDHAQQQLQPSFQELLPLLCQAVESCPQFRQQVSDSLDSYWPGLSVSSICGSVAVATAETAVASTAATSAATDGAPDALQTAVILGDNEEQETKDEEDASGNMVVAAPTAAPTIARREQVPVWARFSDPEEMGVRLTKRPSPSQQSGGTHRRRRATVHYRRFGTHQKPSRRRRLRK